jgi:hypothetical protein
VASSCEKGNEASDSTKMMKALPIRAHCQFLSKGPAPWRWLCRELNKVLCYVGYSTKSASKSIAEKIVILLPRFISIAHIPVFEADLTQMDCGLTL